MKSKIWERSTFVTSQADKVFDFCQNFLWLLLCLNIGIFVTPPPILWHDCLHICLVLSLSVSCLPALCNSCLAVWYCMFALHIAAFFCLPVWKRWLIWQIRFSCVYNYQSFTSQKIAYLTVKVPFCRKIFPKGSNISQRCGSELVSMQIRIGI